jgi:hypothetical protein
MCDLHLSLYMFLYVYVAYSDNVAIKSKLALGCSLQPGCPRGTLNRRHVSNMVRLLLVPQ